MHVWEKTVAFGMVVWTCTDGTKLVIDTDGVWREERPSGEVCYIDALGLHDYLGFKPLAWPWFWNCAEPVPFDVAKMCEPDNSALLQSEPAPEPSSVCPECDGEGMVDRCSQCRDCKEPGDCTSGVGMLSWMRDTVLCEACDGYGVRDA